jgi:hypothetical protein
MLSSSSQMQTTHPSQASCVAAVPPPDSPCAGLTVGQLLSW